MKHSFISNCRFYAISLIVVLLSLSTNTPSVHANSNTKQIEPLRIGVYNSPDESAEGWRLSAKISNLEQPDYTFEKEGSGELHKAAFDFLGFSLPFNYSENHFIADLLLVALLISLVFYSVFLARARRQLKEEKKKLKFHEEELEKTIEKRTAEYVFERDKLRSIFNSMEDGVYIVNKDYIIEYANPSFEKTYGSYDGRKCYEFFHDLEAPCDWCAIEGIFEGKTIRREFTSAITGKTYDLLETPELPPYIGPPSMLV